MIQQAIRTIRTMLPADCALTKQQIEETIDSVLTLNIYRGLNKQDLLREIEALYNIRLENFSVIEGIERRRRWINDKKASIQWGFWNRYRDYLQIEENYSDTVINQIDRFTDRTLDGLFDPLIVASIKKYGLVVGQVQSGKTSNYTGLICKSADAGYKLIIVLAGLHNNLRSQTQFRIDEGFLGFDTKIERSFRQSNQWIGVGNIYNYTIAHSLTSSDDKGDFTSSAANSSGINFNTNEPIIAVVKKNARVLERLYQWLASKATDLDGKRIIRNKSLLLIDDEADNASINTNPETDPATRINGLIRDIIGLFEKSGYVGFTATPFANIFIPLDEDNLFPRDFIINLSTPSNYIGPEKTFGFNMHEDESSSDDVLPIVRIIDDYYSFIPTNHRNNLVVKNDPPNSLRMAIKSFIIICAIRRLRGQLNVHNSMLVHITRYTNWQRYIKQTVDDIFNFYRRGIEMNIPAIIDELRLVFEEDTPNHRSFRTITSQILNSSFKELDNAVQLHTWNDVLKHLNDACSRIQVKEINGGSADALNYIDHPNGLSVIAIGGDKLSRGLTLSGLSVSYFLRSSRMYDTLMQMGRWFGYRQGYVDLCRLYTSRDLNEWFCHIALASEELRSEFDYMSDTAGSTPLQYALRVRTHPGVLQISASNKIRRAEEVRVSWSGRLVESYELSKNPDIISRNLQSANNLISNLDSTFIRESNYYLWRNVDYQLIRQYFLNFSVYDNLKSAAPSNLIRYIDFKYSNGEPLTWSIALITKRDGVEYRITDNISVKLTLRRIVPDSPDDAYMIRKSHIISPNDEFIDLTEEERKRAREASIRIWNEKNRDGEPSRLNGDWVRNHIRKPNKVLLLLYYLDPVGANLASDSNPIVGFAISFPGTDQNDAVSYAVHEQLLSNFNQILDNEQDIEADEED